MKTKRKRQWTYDYYTVKVPGDTGVDIDHLAHIALNEAHERARLFAIPSNWYVKLVSGQPGDSELTFRVTRVRRKQNVG